MTGGSGLGKTAITKLLVQTTHCLNRQPSSPLNCGTCAVCQSDPQLSSGYSNVVWVAVESNKDADGKEITYQRSIMEALHLADRGPSSTGHPHRDVLFIVFEEAHLMPQDLFQRCLARADAVNPYGGDVVLMFLTMDPEKLPAKARQAISQRGAILILDTPTNQQISQLLQKKFEVQPEIGDLIAAAAQHSIRGAYSAYKDCLDFATPITVESIQSKLRFATGDTRIRIWQAIAARLNPTVFKATVLELIGSCDKLILIKHLQDDLDANYDLLGEQLWWTASKLLNQYLYSPKDLSLIYLLLNLRSLTWPPSFYAHANPDQPFAKPSFINQLLTQPWTDLRHSS